MNPTQTPSFAVRTIESLRGPAGRLEALLNTGAPGAKYAVLVCHPHPLGGGTMHNKVVYHTMKAFQGFRLPILFAGFSFGSYVGLHVCCGDARVKGLVALGLPVHAEGRDYRYDFLSMCTKPKLFVSGTRDQYGPKAKVESVEASAASPKEIVWI